MYLKYSSLLKDNLFESKETRYLRKLIDYYHSKGKGKNLVPLNSLYTLINTNIKENEAIKYKNIIAKIKKYPLQDMIIADETVRKFVKRQIMKTIVLEIVNSEKSEEEINIDRIKTRIDEALLIESADLGNNGDYDYYTNPLKRLAEEKDEPRVATGIDEVDIATRRGLAAGELGLVVAPTSVGKTMILINFAYNMMKQGKNVLYTTLELSGKKIAGRMDLLVTNKDYLYVLAHPMLVHRKNMKLKAKGGGFYIKDSTAAKLSPNDLSISIERMSKKFKPDVVIVDQIDLMYSPKEYKERRHELSNILIALRRMGASFGIPVWSASQATRIAGAAGNTTLWDIAEDIGKANWADVILTLSQSPEDKEENLMFLDVAKNRIGEGNPRVVLQANYALMKLSSRPPKEKEDDS
jgi:replicative DNA helicase